MFSETASEDDSFFEYPNDTLVSICTDNDEELVCNNDTQFDKNILGSEFKDYTSNLPLITTPIAIEVGTRTSVKYLQIAPVEKEFLSATWEEDIMSGFQDQH
ncbi:protein far1-related sequence 5-like [Gigaspora margarita]|uniref:Protein far1-related sequence 5-like n=1 Tax=Gigaspora margarita TaxID=4874 RepID=A0A8H3XLT5_GIGMA|nr:protein far1-related sequence 5-like [Gigaspora margarita]